MKREINQDRAYFRHGSVGGRGVCVAAVCDGVGSLEHSALASQLVMDYLDNWLSGSMGGYAGKRRPERIVYEELKNSLRETLWAAHQQVVTAAETDGIAAATTVCLMLVVGGLYCVYSSGDSRAYEVARKAKQLTQDQVAERNGAVSLEYCLGCHPGPNFSRLEGKISKRTAYLMATDGLYRRQDWTEAYAHFKKCKTSEELDAAMQYLCEQVLSKGENDDVSGVVFKFM